MAAESGRNAGTVEDPLWDQPECLEFFQAVRLLRERYPDKSDIGTSADPDEEFVRFKSDLSFAFANTNVVSLERPSEPGGAPELSVSFMGVASPGSFGSLPYRYTEEIHRQLEAKNPAVRDFLDLFNHRFISLFYRAWEKYRFSIRHERGDESNFFEQAVFAIIGLATPGLRGRLPFDDRALLSRAGLLAMAPVPACVLENLVESFFGVEAEAQQFRLRRYLLDPEERSYLGTANATLGQDLVVGAEVNLNQYQFRLRLGPMGWPEYQSLLPDAPGYASLMELVRLSLPPEFEFEVQLVLRREDAPPLQLGAAGPDAPRLGWTTWASSGALDRDPDDALFASQQRPSPNPQPDGRPALPGVPEAVA